MDILTTPQIMPYACAAGVNPPDGLGRPNDIRRTCAPQCLRYKAHFLCLSFARCSMAGCVGTPSGVPGPDARSANPAQSVTQPCLAASGGGSPKSSGTITMNPFLRLKSALNPSALSRAQAHRAMAMHALRSNSSLKNRLKRYRHHSEKARQLESTGGAA